MNIGKNLEFFRKHFAQEVPSYNPANLDAIEIQSASNLTELKVKINDVSTRYVRFDSFGVKGERLNPDEVDSLISMTEHIYNEVLLKIGDQPFPSEKVLRKSITSEVHRLESVIRKPGLGMKKISNDFFAFQQDYGLIDKLIQLAKSDWESRYQLRSGAEIAIAQDFDNAKSIDSFLRVIDDKKLDLNFPDKIIEPTKGLFKSVFQEIITTETDPNIDNEYYIRVITKKAMKTSAGGMFSGSLWTNFSKVDENFDIIGEFLKFSKDRLAVKKNALNQINTALAGATDVSLLINEIDVRKDDLSLSDEEINNCRAFIQNSFSEVSNKEATTVFDDARWNGKIAPKWKKLFLKNAGRIGISTIFSDASGSGLLDKVIELAKINIKNNRSFFNASKDKSPGMIDMLTLEFIKRIKAQPSTDELISLLRGAGVHKFTVNLALPKKTATDLDQITSGFNFLKLSDDLKEMKRNGLHSGLKIENIPEVFGIRDRFMELTNTEGGVLKTEKEIRDRIHSATNISELLIIFDDVRAMSDSSSLTKGLKTYFKTHFGDFEKVENKIEKALKDGNRELVIIDQIHDHFDVQKKLRQLLGKEIDSRFFEGVVNRFDNKNRLTPEQAREEIRQINPDAADINVEFEKLYTILRKLQKVKVSTTLGTTVKYIDSLRIIAKIQAAQQSAKRGARLSLMLGEKGVDEVGIKDMAEKLLEKNFFNRTRRARMDRFPSIEAHTVDFVKDIKATTDIFQLYALLGRQNDGKLLKLKNERAPSKPDFRAMMYEIQQYTMEPDLKKSLKLLPEAYGIKEKVLAFKVDAARTLNEIENLLNALASGAALAVTDRVKIVDSTGTSSNISVFAIKNEIEVYKRTRPKNHALITNDYFGIKTKIINAGF